MLDHLTSIVKCKQKNMTQNIQESRELHLRFCFNTEVQVMRSKISHFN